MVSTIIAYRTAGKKRSFINFKWVEINFQAIIKKWNQCWTTVESAAGFICDDFCQISKEIFTSTFPRFSGVASLCMSGFHKQTWPSADTNSWLSLLEWHWRKVYLTRLINCMSLRASNQVYTSQNNDIAQLIL